MKAFNFSVGWRIWKMRNNLNFNQKREHIAYVIHATIRDYYQWRNAIAKEKEEDQIAVAERRVKPTIQTKMPHEVPYYCLVDASWKSLRACASLEPHLGFQIFNFFSFNFFFLKKRRNQSRAATCQWDLRTV